MKMIVCMYKTAYCRERGCIRNKNKKTLSKGVCSVISLETYKQTGL